MRGVKTGYFLQFLTNLVTNKIQFVCVSLFELGSALTRTLN
jgi:hypothetical protein